MGLPAFTGPLKVRAARSCVAAGRNHTECVEKWQSCRDRFGGVGRGDRASRGIPHLPRPKIRPPRVECRVIWIKPERRLKDVSVPEVVLDSFDRLKNLL